MYQNDNAPEFSAPEYSVSIPEDTPGGTPIIQVNAKDRDRSSPNNEVMYRIQSGAKDKFVINPETGMISISHGANLDPDLTIPSTNLYILEVIAMDGGIGSDKLSSRVTVNVSISDVNNKLPRFGKIRTVTVREDILVGEFIIKLAASDSDENSNLRFRIDYSKSEARNEEGRNVDISVIDWRHSFSLNDVNGEIRTAALLDRELIQV